MENKESPQIIDVHQHCFPPEYLAVLKECDIKVAALMNAPLPDWSLESHLAGMDEASIATGFLSITGGFIYSRSLTRKCNEYFAKIISNHPSRLGAFAVLPFPDVDACLKEIEYAIDILKLDGIGLITNVQGIYLGDPETTAIFDELNRRKQVVCIHPNDPPYGSLSKVKVPWAMIEFPLETTRTLGYMLHGGILKRCPDIKFILPHAGGALPYVAARYANFGRNIKALTSFQSQYYDITGATNRYTLASLQNFVDPSHILFGSDFGMMGENSMVAPTISIKELLEYQGFNKEDMRNVQRNNAINLFPRLKLYQT
jgi:predicted TIM-barrel fold metal-dependent hydrolase